MRFFEILYSDKFMSRFDTIERWSNWHTIHRETLPHHSWWVTMITKMLCIEFEFSEKDTYYALEYALIHDLDEGFSGDLDHALKYNKYSGDEVRESLDEFNREMFYDFFEQDTDLDEYFLSVLKIPNIYIKLIVKLADIIAFQQYLRIEIKLGNSLVRLTYNHSVWLLKQHLIKMGETEFFNQDKINEFFKYEF